MCSTTDYRLKNVMRLSVDPRRGLHVCVALLLAALLSAPSARAQVRLLESEAVASGFGSVRPPGPGEPLGTEVCGQSTVPIDPNSVIASDTATCAVSNDFGGGAFTSEFLLDIDDTQGTVSAVFISAQSSCNTDPFVPPTFRQSNNRADSGANVTVEVEVEAPVVATFTFSGAVDENVAAAPPGSVGSGFGIGTSSASLRSPVLCNPGVNCDLALTNCLSTETGPCLEGLFPQSFLLEPGIYRIEVQANVRSESNTGLALGLAADASASASLLVRFEVEVECDLTWNESGTGGAFSDAANWSPPQSPQDGDTGCNDLLLDRPGTYNLTYGAGAEADSITVLQGEPHLTGGSLTLGGLDDTALNVSGDASLKIDGVLEADSVLVSGTKPLLTLQPGASLTVVTALETGRAADEQGGLNLGGGETQTTLSVAGDMTLAGTGISLLSGLGPLQFDVLGDLSMAVFPGSDAGMALGLVSDAPTGTVNFVVAGAFNMGGAGEAAATMAGPFTGNVDSMQLGLLQDGIGILNLIEGATLTVANELRVGVEGTGRINVSSNAALAADTLLLGGPEPDSAAGTDAPSQITVGSGGNLTVTTTFEVGRDVNQQGQIDLGGGEPQTTVSVVGDMTLAGAGNALLSGQGPLQFDVLGDLSMAVFPGSDAGMALGVVSDAPTGTINFIVGGAFTVGGAGEAAATLAGPISGTVNSLQLGLLENGVGILNVIEGASLSVNSDVLVGGAGLGTLNLTEGAGFQAVNLTVDGPAGEDGSVLRLSGASGEVSSRMDLGLNLVVGNAKRGLWTMEGSTRLEAGIIILGSQENATGSATLSGSLDINENDTRTVTVSASETMMVGLSGSGSFASAGVADIQLGELSLAVNEGSTGNYFATGAQNATTIQEDLVVGGAGSAQLELRSGGIVAGACILGAERGGFGNALIAEGGALIIAPQFPPEEKDEEKTEGSEKTSISFPGFLEIGRKANGIIELFDSATRLACDEAIIGGDNAAAGGTLNVDSGATVDCGGSLTLGADIGPGLVRVADSASMNVVSSIIIGPNGLFITGLANITSGNVIVNGLLRVVNGLRIEQPLEKSASEIKLAGGGPAVINGNLQVGPSGTLEVTAGSGNALVITGAANLDGTLTIALPTGVAFSEGQLLDIIQVQGDATGSFATVTFANAPPGFQGNVEVGGGTLRLRVTSGGAVDPEGEGEGEGESEIPTEGEGEWQGEEEPGPWGCCTTGNKNLTLKDLFTRALGDWLLVGISLLTLTVSSYFRKE